MKKFFLLSIFFFFAESNAQGTLGFGCLGLVGGFAGYEIQSYEPDGLNAFVNDYNLLYKDSLTTPISSFGDSRGFRIGLNLFRRNFSGMIITFKTFYRSLSEKRDAKLNISAGLVNSSLEYKSTSFAFGADVGTQISRLIDWKILDVTLLLTDVRLTTTTSIPGALSSLRQAESVESIYGYSAGTGFILSIVPGYITFETTLAFTQNIVNRLRFDDGKYFSLTSNGQVIEKLVSKGGLNVILQLNIGFPF